jgi:hypothetical protein
LNDFCSLDEISHEETLYQFVEQVLKKLEGDAKRVLNEDVVVCHVLLIEFSTHPCNGRSAVKLCNLVCNFFAPLLSSSGVTLPSNLLQFRHKQLLTQRLHAYDDKINSKVCKNLIPKYLDFQLIIPLLGDFVESSEEFGGAKLQAPIRSSQERWQSVGILLGSYRAQKLHAKQ